MTVVAKDLAALMYFEEPKKIKVKMTDAPGGVIKFEDLTPAEQKPYLDRAKRILVHIEKMDLLLVTPGEFTDFVKVKMVKLAAIKKLIGEFVAKLTHPKDVARFFPVDELSIKVVEEAAR